MHNCNICFNSFVTINVLRCCKGKRMCIKCKDKYGKNTCPFCRQNMNRQPTVIIINKNTPKPEKSDIIFSVMNYNVIRIW
jgi:hypothetical protein